MGNGRESFLFNKDNNKDPMLEQDKAINDDEGDGFNNDNNGMDDETDEDSNGVMDNRHLFTFPKYIAQ